MDHSFCFDCQYFVPEGMRHNDLTEDQWDEDLEGECRAGLPVLGQLLTDRNGAETRHFGEWPKVMACDWCGRFQTKPVRPGPRGIGDSQLTENGGSAHEGECL